jgi:hypothetical protein
MDKAEFGPDHLKVPIFSFHPVQIVLVKDPKPMPIPVPVFANLTQTLCLGQLAKKHGHILIP